MRPGKILRQVLSSLAKKPATLNYPAEKTDMPVGFRGKIRFYPEKCVGCRLCVKDCPSDAIEIRKTGDKRFEAEINIGKCIYCGQCAESCLKKALEVTKEFELAQLDKDKLKVVFRAGPEKTS
ncbi:MAG: 4Fe-4S binding protein [Candidatus Omnitrophota bacterium]